MFTRTRESTTVIAEQLRQSGLKASPLNGDMDQKVRLRTVGDLKSGALDVLVATDVAARGLDVDRITHVINYDVPFDEEAYVHRIGRTGRAGRKGKAILFVVPRERRMLRNIERLTRQSIPEIRLPSVLAIDAKRREAFADSIRTALADPMQAELEEIIDTLNNDADCDYRSIAVALAGMLHNPGTSKGAKHAKTDKHSPYGARDTRDEKAQKPNRKERRQGLQKKSAASESDTPSAPKSEKHLGEARPLRDHPDVPMERFRVEVGRKHGVKPGELMTPQDCLHNRGNSTLGKGRQHGGRLRGRGCIRPTLRFPSSIVQPSRATLSCNYRATLPCNKKLTLPCPSALIPKPPLLQAFRASTHWL